MDGQLYCYTEKPRDGLFSGSFFMERRLGKGLGLTYYAFILMFNICDSIT